MSRRIVIVGSDHGGAWLAARLKKALRGSATIRFVTEKPETVILPSLAEHLGTDGEVKRMNFRNELAHLHVEVYPGTLKDIDQEEQRVILDHGALGYDILIIDPAMEPAYTAVGAKDYAFPLTSRADAHKLARHIDLQLHRAALVKGKDRDAGRTIVISASDVQGVQVALAIAARTTQATRENDLDPRIILLGETLPGTNASVRDELAARLQRNGIEFREESIKRVSPNHVELASGKLPCNTLVWTDSWKPKTPLTVAAAGVYVMPADPPYWPVTGRAAARDAFLWAMSYLSGKPRPPKTRERTLTFWTPDGVLRIGKRLRSGVLASFYRWRQYRRFLDL